VVDPWKIPNIGEKFWKFQMNFGILWNFRVGFLMPLIYQISDNLKYSKSWNSYFA
jgi:hypothetical protein